jgi:metallo-beta-lactamase class B
VDRAQRETRGARVFEVYHGTSLHRLPFGHERRIFAPPKAEATMKSRFLIAAGLVLFTTMAGAQQRVHLPIQNKAWETPFPGFKIVGNLYYVGTYDLGCYLVSTRDGLILINSGAPGSFPLIKANIESLGFKLSDIKLITSTHGHWDHVGDLAELQRASGAKVLMNERDADVLESGGNIDWRNPKGRGIIYDPIKVDRRLKDGDKITLGDAQLTVHFSPGHTKGATSFTLPVKDGARAYNVLIANMPGINAGVHLLGSPGYPNMSQDFAYTIADLKKYTPDIWVSSHAGQFNLHQVYKPGDPYNPARFGDLAAYRAKIEGYDQAYHKQLAQEQSKTE